MCVCVCVWGGCRHLDLVVHASVESLTASLSDSIKERDRSVTLRETSRPPRPSIPLSFLPHSFLLLLLCSVLQGHVKSPNYQKPERRTPSDVNVGICKTRGPVNKGLVEM